MPMMRVLKEGIRQDGKDLKEGATFEAPAEFVPSLVERGLAEKASDMAPRLRPKPKEKEGDDA